MPDPDAWNSRDEVGDYYVADFDGGRLSFVASVHQMGDPWNLELMEESDPWRMVLSKGDRRINAIISRSGSLAISLATGRDDFSDDFDSNGPANPELEGTMTTKNWQYRLSTLLIVTTVVAANLSVSCLDLELAFLTTAATLATAAIVFSRRALKRSRYVSALHGIAVATVATALVIGAISSYYAFSLPPNGGVWFLGGGYPMIIMGGLQGGAVGLITGLAVALVYGLLYLMQSAWTGRASEKLAFERSLPILGGALFLLPPATFLWFLLIGYRLLGIDLDADVRFLLGVLGFPLITGVAAVLAWVSEKRRDSHRSASPPDQRVAPQQWCRQAIASVALLVVSVLASGGAIVLFQLALLEFRGADRWNPGPEERAVTFFLLGLMFLTAVLTTLVGLGALLRIRQASEPLRGRFGALASTWFWPCMFVVLAGTQSFGAWQRNQQSRRAAELMSQYGVFFQSSAIGWS